MFEDLRGFFRLRKKKSTVISVDIASILDATGAGKDRKDRTIIKLTNYKIRGTMMLECFA